LSHCPNMVPLALMWLPLLPLDHNSSLLPC
jgi:hypothetical protein